MLAGAVAAGVLFLAVAGNWWVNGVPGFIAKTFTSAPAAGGE